MNSVYKMFKNGMVKIMFINQRSQIKYLYMPFY